MAKYANIASKPASNILTIEVPVDYVTNKPKPKYNLEEIENIRGQGIDYQLPQATIELITQLSKLVGSPEYIRTPVFTRTRVPGATSSAVDEDGWQRKDSSRRQGNPRDGRDGKRNGHGHGHGRGGGGKAPPVSDADWELLKSFKTTAKITPEEKDKLFFEMQGILNKISDKNYDTQKDKILEMLARNMEKEDFERITKLVFDVASSNKFFVSLYANLFCVLLDEYPIFNSMLENEMSNLVDGFASMEFVDPNTDYDKFCEMNLQNEARKSLCLLVAHLMKKNIVSIKQVCVMLTKIQAQLLITLEKENHKDVAFEMTEAIYALNKEGRSYMKEGMEKEDEETQGLWDAVQTFEKAMIKRKPKSMPSFDNKVLFKWMDIADLK